MGSTYDPIRSRDGMPFRLPKFNLSVMTLLGMFLAQPSTLVLPPLEADPVAGGNSRRPSRIQPHTGGGRKGAHRRWKARRAAGVY